MKVVYPEAKAETVRKPEPVVPNSYVEDPAGKAAREARVAEEAKVAPATKYVS